MNFFKKFSRTSLLIAALVVLGITCGTIEFAVHSYATTNSNLPALEQQLNQLTRLEQETKKANEKIDKSQRNKEDLYQELKPVRIAISKGYSPVVGYTIIRESKRWGLTSDFVMGLIDVEAGPAWKNHSPNAFNCQGLMQINGSDTAMGIASDLGHDSYDLMDPVTNIKFGTYYIAKMIRAYGGNVHAALTAYNRGDGGYQQYVAMTGTSRSGYSVEVLRRQVRYENLD